jgi:hypothetical protein
MVAAPVCCKWYLIVFCTSYWWWGSSSFHVLISLSYIFLRGLSMSHLCPLLKLVSHIVGIHPTVLIYYKHKFLSKIWFESIPHYTGYLFIFYSVFAAQNFFFDKFQFIYVFFCFLCFGCHSKKPL